MKKIISILLLLAFAVSFIACSGTGEAVDTTAPDTTITDTTDEVTTEEVTTEAPETEPAVKPDPIVSEVDKRFVFTKDGEKRVFVDSNGFELPYCIYIPKDYNEDYAYPLVLFLHGAGERGNENGLQLKYTAIQPFMDKSCPIYQSIVIAPQCPNDYQWADTPWTLGSYSTDEVPISEAMSAVVELLDAMIEEFSINENRQYVFGLSMGGYGTWDLLCRFPDRFAAAIPLCGGGDPSKAADLVDVPIQVFHDTDDTSVPVSGSRDMVEAIIAAGGEKITYTETSGYGHAIWDVAIYEDNLSLIYWMFEQRRG